MTRTRCRPAFSTHRLRCFMALKYHRIWSRFLRLSSSFSAVHFPITMEVVNDMIRSGNVADSSCVFCWQIHPQIASLASFLHLSPSFPIIMEVVNDMIRSGNAVDSACVFCWPIRPVLPHGVSFSLVPAFGFSRRNGTGWVK